MKDVTHQPLIQSLGADLTPVRRPPAAGWRSAIWLAIVAATGIVLAGIYDVGPVAHRLSSATDMWLAAAGCGLTAVLAAIATFKLSLPDRSPAWALLPLPAATVWIVASGIGCLRAWPAAESSVASFGETESCLIFILGFSVPLSLLLILLVRQGYALRPKLTYAVGGLACAAAAAVLLNFIHPFDAAATDLAVHALAVGIVIGVNILIGERVFAAKKFPG